MADFLKRLKETGASASEFLKDATVITGDVLKDAAVNAGEALKDAGITTGKALKDAGDAVGCGAADVVRGAAETYDQWFGEDIGKILAECPVAKHILQHRDFRKGPGGLQPALQCSRTPIDHSRCSRVRGIGCRRV